MRQRRCQSRNASWKIVDGMVLTENMQTAEFVTWLKARIIILSEWKDSMGGQPLQAWEGDRKLRIIKAWECHPEQF